MNRYLLGFLSIWSMLLTSLLAEVRRDEKLGLHVGSQSDESNFEIIRPYGQLYLDFDSETGTYSLNLSLLAWQNLAADDENGLDVSRVEARSGLVNFFFDTLLISVGQMIIDWGETFGYRPSDLVNARDIRNFSPLDLESNKIPIAAIRTAMSLEDFHGELIYSPLGSYPILPKKLNDGTVLREPSKNRAWFEQAEFGIKTGVLFDSGNVDLFVYRHLNRVPVLSFELDAWKPEFMMINSLGLNSAFSFDTWVLRLDSIISPKHPYLLRTPTIPEASAEYSSLTVGLDWNLSHTSLLGIQIHQERFPISDDKLQRGLSIQARESFWNNYMDIGFSVYRGIVYRDEREELNFDLKLKDGIEIGFGGERMHWANGSPMALTGNFCKYTGKIAYHF